MTLISSIRSLPRYITDAENTDIHFYVYPIRVSVAFLPDEKALINLSLSVTL